MEPKRLSILVIDDDENIASTVALLLSRDHEVTTATDARDGLKLALSGSFDIIFCDLNMPRLSGVELFEKLSTAIDDVSKRIVFMTGGATDLETQEFLDRGEARIIEKPFSLSELRKLVQGFQASQ